MFLASASFFSLHAAPFAAMRVWAEYGENSPRSQLPQGWISPLPSTARHFYDFPMNLSEKIREEIRSRELSMRRIHLETGLDRSTIRRFIATGKGNIQTLDTIATFLGASIAFQPAEPKPKKRPKKAE